MTDKKVCPAHSGMVMQNKSIAKDVAEIKLNIKEILEIVRPNEKKIDKIYIISYTAWTIMSGMFGLFVLAVKYKLI